MSPLATALIFFAGFLLVGLMAKVAIGIWIWIKRSVVNPPARKMD